MPSCKTRRTLPGWRRANSAETAATPQGGSKPALGKVSVLDNMVDTTTGTIMVRATFPNADESLWPGQLCNVRVTLRIDPDTISGFFSA